MARGDAHKDDSDVVDDLVERARAESIGSIDHAVNAKAIALGDGDVQSAIRELLGRDYQLVAIEPLRGFGSSLMSFPLRFVFRPGANSGPIALDESFVVLLELPTRTVKRISRSSELPSASDVPFVVAAIARVEPSRFTAAEMAPRYEREALFYRAVGLENLGWAPGAAGTDQTITILRRTTATDATYTDVTTDGNMTDSSKQMIRPTRTITTTRSSTATTTNRPWATPAPAERRAAPVFHPADGQGALAAGGRGLIRRARIGAIGAHDSNRRRSGRRSCAGGGAQARGPRRRLRNIERSGFSDAFRNHDLL
jgi:hypothetical protein